MTIAVIDSGVANLASVMGALARLNADAVATTDVNVIKKASHVILPGVGAAQPAMKKLRALGLTEIIPTLTQPVIGICLGMQLMFASSDEGDGVACLGMLAGDIKRLQATSQTPVPHMGWNTLNILAHAHPLLAGVAQGAYVYFVHSFAAPVGDATLASTQYGQDFSAIVGRDNFMGCQFHPERSSVTGQRILENFLRL